MPDGEVIVDLAEPEGRPPQAAPQRDASRSRQQHLRSEQDDDKDYSRRVQKRMGKLTAQKAEFEQRASYWQRQAMAERARADEAEARNRRAEKVGREYFATTVASEMESAREALETAIAEGDPKKIAEAQVRVSRAAAKERDAQRMAANAPADDEPAPGEQERRQAAPPPAPAPPPRTQKWLRDNASWFQKDPELTKEAIRINEDLRAEGLDPSLDSETEAEYFDELDRRLAEKFPDEFAAADDVQEDEPEERPLPRRQPARAAAPVQPARRPPPREAERAPGKVRLTETEVEIANSLGVDLKSYAQGVLRRTPDRVPSQQERGGRR